MAGWEILSGAAPSGAIAPQLLVDDALWVESVENEGKGDIVDNILGLAANGPLNHHIADIAAFRDAPGIKGRILPLLPGNDDIAFVDMALLAQQRLTITERYLKFPLDYLQQVFGESITPYHANQRWANLGGGKPAFQA